MADLLEELDYLWDMVEEAERESFASSVAQELQAYAAMLRQARESANKPKLKEGQEVWVRGQVAERMNVEQITIVVGEGFHATSVIFEDASGDIKVDDE